MEDFIHDLQLVEEEEGLVGPQLNRRKIELICNDPSTRNAVSELQVITCGHATLLGTPIGSIALIDITTSSKIETLKLKEEKLQQLSSQDALLLLHNLFTMRKVVYLLCTAPCFLSEQ